MHRLVRQAIVFFALLFVVTLLRLPYGSYRTTALPRLRQLLAPMRMSVDLDDVVVGFPASVEATGVKLLVPAGPLPLPVAIDTTSLSLELLPLFWLSERASLQGQLYGGTANGSFSRPVFGSSLNGVLHLDTLRLDMHPLLKTFGVQGKLTAAATLATGDSSTLSALDLLDVRINLADAAMETPPTYLSLVKLPPVRDLSAAAHAVLKKNRLAVDELRTDSSLGHAAGSGTFMLDPTGLLASGSATIDLDLTDEGVRAVGGYLALAAGSNVDQPPKAWKVEIGVTGLGRVKVSVHPRS